MTQTTLQQANEILRGFISNFHLLSEQEIQLIIDNAKLKQYKKGEFLLKEGQVSQNCFFVLEGVIREFHLQDGEEKTTAFYLEQESVNAFSSALDQTPAQQNLIAAEDTWVTVGSQSLELAMCQQIPRLEHIIRKEVEKNTGILQRDFAKFIASSPAQRYQNLLDSKPQLFQRVPQHQIASYLGITPESLSRLRKRLLTQEEK
ncbi:cAMP-binding domain of CRP or a regulatory subunit of cAMP-dependent protein kinases [Lishizhenia tianjinensis]|uniref:cAMP-binding domain of CRP or a regulatory subunit of cAMP-dependent protein kinases n=1 Tax=Lishizhenia tianjinensis TaxID=477690 RepID=A0A1I7B125_9FLAO|nr:Crp/Fnr family transcriptional regulator [Lishizhenia tianjinensis]SFT80887.1 cAMP-binding domain of CRP or a regulatory subunit of cAMP-dependent protein kinases [Lishizhenia tianjinensis]